MQIQAVSELNAQNVSGYQTALKATKNSLPAPTALNGNTKLWIEISKLVDAAAGKYQSMKLLFSDFTKNVYALFQAVNNKTVDIDKAISDLAGSTGTQFDELRGMIATLNEKVDSNKATLDGEIASLKSRVDSLETRMTSLEGRVNTVERAINDNPGGLKARMTSVEGRATNLETRATNLEGRATSLEGRAGALETGLQGANQNINNIIAGGCTAYLRLANVPQTVQGSITFQQQIKGTAEKALWS